MSWEPTEEVIRRIREVYGRWRRETSAAEMRADWDALFDRRVEAAIEPAILNDVCCEWVRPEGARRDAVVVYLHGGGFRMGSLISHRELMARLSRESGIQVLGVGYRLAPEHPLPAALDDVMAVIEGLASAGFAAEKIALAGDSAGGALALGALIARQRSGKPLLAAAYLMSAWTDLTATGESYDTRAQLDPIHQRPMIRAIARGALGPGAAADDPLLSPLFADAKTLGALPPIHMQVGERETLVSDTEAFARRAQAAGASVSYEIWPGMIHVFQQFPDDLHEARQAVAMGARFLASRLEPALKESDPG